MAPVVVLFSLLATLLVLVGSAFWLRASKDESWKNRGLRLPPGTMGWPLIGETLSFLKIHPSNSLGDYLEERIKMYGKIFKANLLGSQTVVSADAELNRFVLLNDGRLFEPSCPRALLDILGHTTPMSLTGDQHRYIKSLAVDFMGIGRLKSYLLPDAELYITQTLASWKEGTPFQAKEEAYEMMFNLMAKNILSMKPGVPETERIRKLYMSFMTGVMALPLNFPGTAYRKAVEARKVILGVINELMKERIQKRGDGTDDIGEADLLGFVLERYSNLEAEQFGDLLLGLLFAGYETSATAITLLIYFLHDCPLVVQKLREEHLEIVRMKRQRGEPAALTWEDYKLMEFSQCVVRETLRLGNVVKGVERKANTDIKFKEYDIPRGWTVLSLLTAAHVDPTVYENVHKFDPWRWQQTGSTSKALHDNYMPFGLGHRNCAGLQLAKLEIVVFLHHLVLNFDWELAEPDHPVASPFPEFPKGLPIKVRRLSLLQ